MDLPRPLTPADAELRNFRDMPLDVPRLLGSDLVHDESPESCWSAVLLWCVSWHEVPAGSLTDNDEWLAKRAGYWHKGRLDPAWNDVREGALHGWIKCSDGRLYHPVVAEKVNNAWLAKHRHAYEKLGERIRKRNKVRAERGQIPLEVPEFEQWIDAGRPLERDLFPSEFSSPSTGNNSSSAGITEDFRRNDAGIPPENVLKGREGKGLEGNGTDFKSVGDSSGSGTPAQSGEKAPLAAAQISTSLIGWERERHKAARGLTPSNQQVIDLAALRVSAAELRAAYECAVADRLATEDPNPVNAGFIAVFVNKIRNPPKARPKADDWYRTNPGIERKASELGIVCPPGKDHNWLRERCESEIRRRAQGVAA